MELPTYMPIEYDSEPRGLPPEQSKEMADKILENSELKDVEWCEYNWRNENDT